MANHIREFAGLDTAALTSFLEASPKPLEHSQLYSTASQSKLVDPSVRNSAFRTFTEPALFAACEALLERMTAADPLVEYKLVKNNVTHIVYKVRWRSAGSWPCAPWARAAERRPRAAAFRLCSSQLTPHDHQPLPGPPLHRSPASASRPTATT
jgi:hypothetical protein